jgi:hypothetical protein
MPGPSRYAGSAVLAVLLLLLFPVYAWAYVDPGTGSYIFQLAVAGFLAAAFTLRRMWHGVVSGIRSRLGKPGGTGDAADKR